MTKKRGTMSSKNGKTVVVALGGNAILQAGQKGTYEEQYANVDGAISHVMDMIEAGYNVVITHGNGPQVGNLLIQNAEAADKVVPMPLFALGAETQGQIGFMMEQAIAKYLAERKINRTSATLVTQTLVSENDPGLLNPTKPVGPFYDEATAKELAANGITVAEDAGRGWRQVVGSPEPLAITNIDAIRSLVAEGFIVVCAGGGGVPVIDKGDKDYYGVDAVIDKDRAATRLAIDLDADMLLILTAVPKVYINFGKPDQQALDTLSIDEMEELYGQGHFAAGSMGPKVEACLEFARNGGTAIIGELEDGVRALAGETGTRVVPNA